MCILLFLHFPLPHYKKESGIFISLSQEYVCYWMKIAANFCSQKICKLRVIMLNRLEGKSMWGEEEWFLHVMEEILFGGVKKVEEQRSI